MNDFFAASVLGLSSIAWIAYAASRHRESLLRRAVEITCAVGSVLSVLALLLSVLSSTGAWNPLDLSFPDPTNTPTISMMQGASSFGGETIVVLGSGFSAGSTEFAVCMSPCSTNQAWDAKSVAVTSVTSTGRLTAKVAALAAGNYDVWVHNLGGGRTFYSALLVISETLTPPSILTTQLLWQLIGDNAVGTSPMTSVSDTSGNSYCSGSPCNGTPTNSPTVITNDSGFNGHNSMHLVGASSQYIATPSVTLNGGSAPTEICLYGAVRSNQSSSGSSYPLAQWSTGSTFVGAEQSNSALNGVIGAVSASSKVDYQGITIASSVFNFVVCITTTQLTASFDNISAATGSVSTTMSATTAAFDIGTTPTQSVFGSWDVAEMGAWTGSATPTQVTQIFQYLNNKYQSQAAPQIMTPISGSGLAACTSIGSNQQLGYRCAGVGFLPGIAGQVTIGGTTTSLGCSYISQTRVECCTGWPTGVLSGTPSIFKLTNMDTQATSFTGLSVVATSTDPMAANGCGVNAWYAVKYATDSLGNTPPLNGNKVSNFNDLSYSGNDDSQGTSANQCTVTTSDSNFGGGYSCLWNGSSTTYLSTTQHFSSTPSQLDLYAVGHQASTSGAQIAFYTATGATNSADIIMSSGGTPKGQIAGSSVVTWSGGAISGTNEVVEVYGPSTAVSIDVNNGTATTSTASSFTGSTSSGNLIWGSFNGSTEFYNGSMSCAALAGSAPTSMADMRVYFQTQCGAP